MVIYYLIGHPNFTFSDLFDLWNRHLNKKNGVEHKQNVISDKGVEDGKAVMLSSAERAESANFENKGIYILIKFKIYYVIKYQSIFFFFLLLLFKSKSKKYK